MNNNILIIDKERDISSNKKLMEVKNELKINKCGFVGTLDPFATGLLIICCGKYTKLVDYFHLFSKTYIATINFGKSTDTLDDSGEFVYEDNYMLDKVDLENSLKKFKNYDQLPPIYSAKRINGKRAYEFAREGKTVELKKKNVTIYNSNIVDIKDNIAIVEFEVSSGTYIRTLCDDIAKEMGTRSYLKELRRTKIGDISINDKSVNIDEVFKIKNINIENDFEKKLVLNGQLPNLYKESINEDGLYNIYYSSKKLALYERKMNKWKIIPIY